MLYTKKGDDGKTSLFHCDQRLSKSSAVAEALGSLDETNSFLGIVKAKCHQGESLALEGLSLIFLDK
jgi:cob(I)alamin adenosyltransferase